jgi:uncharacterized protein
MVNPGKGRHMRAMLIRLWIALALICAGAMGGQALAQAPQAPPTVTAPKTAPVTPPVTAPVTAKPTPGGPVFPALTGRVVDLANIIPADIEADLTERLKALELKSSDQLVVVTVPSLQGYEIEEYGYKLGRTWQIGQGERLNNGVILLVAPNERKVRIEVGYGLEGVLTDFATGQIIRNTIVPAFKAGDMAGGIVAGVTEIETLLTLDPAELEARAKRGLPQVEADYVPQQSGGSFFVVLIIVIFLWIVISNANRNQRFATRRRSGWDGAPMSTHDWRTTNTAADVAGDVLGGIISIALSGDGESGGGGGDFGGGGGFSGGGGSFGGGGSSGSW